MDGPWTQFAPAAPAPAQAGPWTLYAAPKPAAPDLTTTSEYGPSYAAPAPAEPSPTRTAIDSGGSAIGNAAVQGWKDTPSILTPDAEAAVDKYSPGGVPLGSQIVNPALKLAGGAIAAGHAGMAALSKAAMEVFGEKGGRDALALLSTLPMAAGERMSPNAAPAPEAPTPPPRFMNELTMPPDTVGLTPLHRIQDLIAHDNATYPPRGPDAGVANQSIAEIGSATTIDGVIEAAGRAVQAPAARPMSEWMQPLSKAAPETPATPGVPQSVGAAASREQTPQAMVDLSMADMKANRRRAEQDELMAPPQPGDNAIHVEGSFPTLAERSGDPEISQTENMLRQRNSPAFVGEGKVLTENNKARVAKVDSLTVPDPTLNAMAKERADQWVAASNDILPTAKPADLTPVAEWAENELSNPRIQENDAVRGVLDDFHGRLFDADGNLKNDPAAVWGIHDHLQNLLNKAKDPMNQTSAEKFAESQILQAKAMIDQAMNVATDNKFQAALTAYAEASKPINAGRLMNEFRPKLTNMAGEVQAANFHRFVLGLAKERGDPGIDPSMDISDAAMRALIDVDNDLKRAGLIKVGAAAGSPTNLLGALAESAGVNAAHSVMGSIPGVGPLIKAGTSALAKLRLDKLTEKHLAAPEGGYIYPQNEP